MNIKLRIALVYHLFVIAFLLVFSIVYLFKSSFMPYHAVAVGQSWQELDSGVQFLISMLMKLSGSGWLTAAVSIAILLLVPFRKAEKWSYIALMLIEITALLPATLMAAYVDCMTAASTPWLATCIVLFLSPIACYLSISKKA